MNFVSKVALASMSLSMILANGSVPAPGALGMSLNSTSIQNIMNTFVPILSYFVLNNHTFEINQEMKGPGYKLDLDSIQIIEATGFTVKKFENIPGTD
jgi:hypothetical protein